MPDIPAVPDAPATCRVCGAASRCIGSMRILGRHEPRYHQCPACGFVQTDGPWWLDEAYADAITATDLGLLARCSSLAVRIPSVLACTGALRGAVLDWGGGYGTLTRMLRDRGIDCRHWDPHCRNVHAPGFESSLDARPRWDAVLAVEVLEHLADPWEFLRPAAARTDLILATTALVGEPAPPLGSWWYWAPEHGQHVSFYARRTMERIARELGMTYVPAGQVHVLARGLGLPARLAMRSSPLRRALLALRRPRGLLARDYAAAVRAATEAPRGLPAGNTP
jgi:Methyltransferase domain